MRNTTHGSGDTTDTVSGVQATSDDHLKQTDAMTHTEELTLLDSYNERRKTMCANDARRELGISEKNLKNLIAKHGYKDKLVRPPYPFKKKP